MDEPGQLAGKLGSSPHARGTLGGLLGVATAHRFIPACAGNARLSADRRARRSVHPRMRGERATRAGTTGAARGSSPHARGTRRIRPGASVPARFIPACAGNARSASCRRLISSVHPRMRGERRRLRMKSWATAGSSPHARGTPIHCPAGHFSIRFIPACAGNAETGSHVTPNETVHPRMRGERDFQAAVIIILIGSSPHARGTP